MNYIDLLIILVLMCAGFYGFRKGFLLGMMGLFVTICSLYISLTFFLPIAKVIANTFTLNTQIVAIFTFLGLILLVESIGGIFVYHVDTIIVHKLYKYKGIKWTDQLFGIIPAVIVALFFIAILLLIPILLPFSPTFKQTIQDSYFGQLLLPKAYQYVPKMEQITRMIPTQSLLYAIPIAQKNEEIVDMHFPKVLTLNIDQASEIDMLEMINRERESRGLEPLTLREEVVPVARNHSRDMFENNYFSHNNKQGETPFDRMDKAGITYIRAGENLAYAPDVEIAHRGLMNSPGHKANILSPHFGQVAIGVIDGGIYGKMFTQEFTD